MAAAGKDAGPRSASGKTLLRLARKRLESFVGIVPKFLVNDDPKLIHDLRVRSRRLHEALRVALPRPKSHSARKIAKHLRRARQALGPCRNLDVNLALAQMRVDTAAGAARDGWRALAADLAAQRQALLAEARKRIGKRDWTSFIGRAQDALAKVDELPDPLASMEDSLRGSLARWDDAYALAEASRGAEELHALRIAGKRLRYRAELLADLGVESIKPMVKDLKQTQSVLGDWHDRLVLLQTAADFIRRPKLMERRPELASALLGQMDEERKQAEAIVEALFRDTPQLRKRWLKGDLFPAER